MDFKTVEARRDFLSGIDIDIDVVGVGVGEHFGNGLMLKLYELFWVTALKYTAS